MYSNIGSKIKTLALILGILGIVGSVLGGISFMFASTFGFRYVEAWQIIAGLAIMIVGSLLSWISQFMLYGFGEIITKLRDIEQHLCEQNKYSGGRFAPPADSALSYTAPARTYNPAPAPTYNRPYNAAPAQPMNSVPVINRPAGAQFNNAPVNSQMNVPAPAPMNRPMNAQPAATQAAAAPVPTAPAVNGGNGDN